jgi:hypothetical protein
MSDLATPLVTIVMAALLIVLQLRWLARTGKRPLAVLRERRGAIIGAILVVSLYAASAIAADRHPGLARRLEGAAMISFALYVLISLWRGIQAGLGEPTGDHRTPGQSRPGKRSR